MDSTTQTPKVAPYLLRSALVAVLVAVIAEVLVFNLPHWESLSFGSDAREIDYTVGPGLEAQEDGSYTVVNVDEAYLTFDMRGERLGNIRVDLSVPSWQPSSLRMNAAGAIIPLTLQFTDAGHAMLTALHPVEYCTNMPVTHYLRPHLSGGSSEMRICFTEEGANFVIDGLACNVVQPFDISWSRLFLRGPSCDGNRAAEAQLTPV